MTDDSLLEQLRSSPRDEELWSQLYERFHPQVFVLAHHLCNDDHDLAQDVTQDAFLRFITSGAIQKVRTRGAAVAYLRAIARNLVRDHYRKRMHHPTVSTGNIAAEDLEDALERIISRTISDIDLLALPSLRDEDRELLRFALEGRTVTEVADRLGLKYSAAAVRLHRLRKQLRLACKETDAGNVLLAKRGKL